MGQGSDGVVAGRSDEGAARPRAAAPAPPSSEERPPVTFHPLRPDVRVPDRSTELSAGYDIRAYLKGRRVRVRRRGSDEMEEASPSADDPEGADEPGRTEKPRLTLAPGDRALVPTGFRARLPPGYEGQIRIRSSLAWKKGLVVPNAPGTVDADYPDEWFVLVQNASDRLQRIEHGERIAQVVIARHAVLPWREGRVGRTTDRTGGLGSTGR